MISRIWHGRTKAEKAESYKDVLIETGVKETRATKGNLGVTVLCKKGPETAEFLFISLWESFEAITRFAGREIEKAVYYPEDKEYLLEFEPEVQHYEVVSIKP